ncbi:MAG: hypothetical protein QM774_10920 [Gordonia sp. (in: high G+C Gram-positive bacteria)]|uniref:hypothetical protein n=1 Tax=Gordonia sp. (in: high G+C Gram-positive bacteria) TaxID=84139 RepID=UPI0039E40273
MTASRSSTTNASGLTRTTEIWPVYNVGLRCAAIGASIVAIIIAIALIAFL